MNKLTILIEHTIEDANFQTLGDEEAQLLKSQIESITCHELAAFLWSKGIYHDREVVKITLSSIREYDTRE